MALKPLFNKILVHPEEKEEKGIVLGEKSPNELIRGKVFEVGEGKQPNFRTATEAMTGKEDFSIPFIVGDFVFFNTFDAKPITVNGNMYYILNWWDVYAREING